MMKNYINTHTEKLFLIFALIILLFAIFLAKAASEDLVPEDPLQVEENQRLELEDVFKKADVIPDGKIDKGEFDIYHYTLFKMFDFDENGWIEKDECMTDCFTYQMWQGFIAENAKKYKRYEFGKTPYHFEAIDINKSESIELFEYIMFGRDRFPYFDKDKNGAIEVQEFCDAYSTSMPCDMTEEYKEKFNTMERNDEKNIISN